MIHPAAFFRTRREILERPDDRLGRMRKNNRAVIVPVAREAGIEGNIVQWDLRVRRHECGEVGSRNFERRVALRGNYNRHVVNIGRAWRFSKRAVVAFENDVRIGAAKAE